MSKDIYPSIFLKPNGDYCLYYPSNVFRNAHLGNIYKGICMTKCNPQ